MQANVVSINTKRDGIPAGENNVSRTTGNHPFAQSVGDVAAADDEIGFGNQDSR